MSKICSNCKANVDDGSLFCPKCGSNSFDTADPNATTVLTDNNPNATTVLTDNAPNSWQPYPTNGQFGAPANTPQEMGNMPPYQSAAPQEMGSMPPYQSAVPQKKSKLWLILVIVAAVVVLAVGGIVAAVIITSDSDLTVAATASSGFSSSDTVTEAADSTVSDSTVTTDDIKGSIVNGQYVNKWAGIKFDVNDDLPNASDSEYSSVKSTLGSSELCFLSQNTVTGKQFIVLVTRKISSSFTESSFLDEEEKSLEKNSTASLTYNIGSREYVQIAGRSYLALPVELVNTSNGATVHMILCVTKKDNRIIEIVITSQYKTELEAMLNNVVPAN